MTDRALYEVVPHRDGVRLACQVTTSCPYQTNAWAEDDGSAQQQFYGHKWRAHPVESVDE